jgi:hypothetical protein
VTAVSDPLPQILEGIPIDYRDVRVEINRPDFTRNPTNCAAMKVTSTLTSSGGKTANPSAPFQASGCGELGFKPSLALALKGQTKRTGNPALTATLKAPEGQANIAKTAVLLPKTEFIDNSHINNPCTRVQFNEGACPAKSILGTAKAESPLLEKPLEGTVYLASGYGHKLPDVLAALKGQVNINLDGIVSSFHQRLRTTFKTVPDVPVTKFTLNLLGGKRGLLVNSANLCKGAQLATVEMTGQNNRRANSQPKIGVSCGGKAGAGGKAQKSGGNK